MQGRVALSPIGMRITNSNSYAWTYCFLTLNPNSEDENGFIHEVPRLGAHARITIVLFDFIDSAGHRFDSSSQVPVLITVSCLTPGGREQLSADLR